MSVRHTGPGHLSTHHQTQVRTSIPFPPIYSYSCWILSTLLQYSRWPTILERSTARQWGPETHRSNLTSVEIQEIYTNSPSKLNSEYLYTIKGFIKTHAQLKSQSAQKQSDELELNWSNRWSNTSRDWDRRRRRRRDRNRCNPEDSVSTRKDWSLDRSKPGRIGCSQPSRGWQCADSPR